MIEGLDLEVISEIKRSSNGAVEIKFLDRMEILKALRDILNPVKGDDDKADELYRALDRAATQLRLTEKDPVKEDGV